MLRKILLAILTILTLALAFIASFPSAGFVREVSLWPGIAHFLAFARIAGIALSLLGVLTVVSAGLLQRRRRVGSHQNGGALVLGLVWFVLGALLGIAPQGFFAQQEQASLAKGFSRELTLVSYNSQDTLSAEDLRFFNDQYGADVYVFPEGGVANVQAAVSGAGLQGKVFEPESQDFSLAHSVQVAPTTIFVRNSMSDVHQETAYPFSFGSTQVSFAGAGAFSLIGLHTAPPLPSLMGNWRSDLALVNDIDQSVSGQEPLIVAGDFNATLRHGSLAKLNNLSDAAMLAGNDDGTWPSDVLPLFSSPIDHVLVSSKIRVENLETVKVGEGDHRAVVAELGIFE